MDFELLILSFAYLSMQLFANDLCYESQWSIVRGNWSFDEDNCSITQSDSGFNDLLWFGSPDGLTPNANYTFDSFILNVSMEIHESQHPDSDALSAVGFFVRAASENPNGPDYWIMVYPEKSKLHFARMDNGFTKLKEKSLGFVFEYNTTYDFQLIATDEFTYTVSANGSTVYDNYDNAKEFTFGSIGIRSFYAASTFHILSYEGLTSTDTSSPTITPTTDPTTDSPTPQVLPKQNSSTNAPSIEETTAPPHSDC